MQMRKAPPGRTSLSWVVTVKPRGAPCQRSRCFGSVQHLNTSSRGASKTRVRTSSHSKDAVAESFFVLIRLLPGLQFMEVIVQAIEARVPEAPIAFEPVRDVFHRARPESTRPPLRLATSFD